MNRDNGGDKFGFFPDRRVPTRGDIPLMSKEERDQGNKLSRWRDTKTEVLDLSDDSKGGDLERYENIVELRCNGLAHILDSDRHWCEETQCWKVLVVWMAMFDEDADDVRQRKKEKLKTINK